MASGEVSRAIQQSTTDIAKHLTITVGNIKDEILQAHDKQAADKREIFNKALSEFLLQTDNTLKAEIEASMKTVEAIAHTTHAGSQTVTKTMTELLKLINDKAQEQ
ncbi:hypothetical protein FALBO_12735 [Fusarium albosuccineum]|uniref:Uncharacterized protein n=1 Tax=Fusarium albosuccineum TaxID=1237068 RepID=A0A8H4PGX7_9HYPO|nr:hypothetical protein FALBO_12735 [Fusarium albosuccineum]